MAHSRSVLALFLAVITPLTVPRGTAAQLAPTPLPDDRVRIWHAPGYGSNPLTAMLVSLGADSLVLRSDGSRGSPARLALPRGAVQVLEVPRLESHLLRYGTIGLVAGAVIGGVIGYSATCKHCGEDLRPLGAVMVGGGGAVVGGIMGLAAGAPRMRWIRATLPP